MIEKASLIGKFFSRIQKAQNLKPKISSPEACFYVLYHEAKILARHLCKLPSYVAYRKLPVLNEKYLILIYKSDIKVLRYYPVIPKSNLLRNEKSPAFAG